MQSVRIFNNYRGITFVTFTFLVRFALRVRCEVGYGWKYATVDYYHKCYTSRRRVLGANDEY
jgi:hypothetical protein